SVIQNFKNNNNHPLRVALRDNDTWRNWTPQAPIRLYFCTNDDQVKYTNSILAYDSLKAKGATIDTANKGNKGHGQCINPSVQDAFLWFLSKKKKYFSVNVQTSPDTGQGSGKAVIVPSNTNKNLDYSWSNGITSSDSIADNLNPGSYTVTVTDPTTSCTRVKDFTIGQSTGLMARSSSDPVLRAYPNPTNNTFTIEINEEGAVDNGDIRLFNTTGKVVKTIQPKNLNYRFTIQSNELSSGVYILEYQTSNGVEHLKLVKN
ncbi:MAG: hypothetical protein BRD50_03500, partial [Bacteroidetes bacterium SW_11_45_7]